ncbi:MAG: rhamnulokinase [Planctomycetes bacterium]|nr:rhamnulokinase [Planctomycetota bacterium]
MAKHYLAFDLGAESGRLMLGRLAHHRIRIKELHRFPNRMHIIKGHLHWDIKHLYREITKGLQIYDLSYKTRPQSIAIDTWGVDFGLLDARGKLIEQPYTYRDHRTKGVMERFFKVFPKERLYNLTGIQMIPINTVFQLYAMAFHKSPALRKAKDLLFIPDILNYYLTGVKATEFTFATTSQLFNPVKQDWDAQILKTIGIPRRIMQDVIQPGSIIGNLKLPGWKDVSVVAVGSHDTASAVAAVPAQNNGWAYISSGTWSLMGIETGRPIINHKSLTMNFTNEGGVGGTYRFLKNIMGLWLLQQCRKCWPGQQDYGKLVTLAHKAPAFRTIIDPDSPEFLNPLDMAAAIRQYCLQTNQPAPNSPAQFTRCIIESLALKYRYVLEQLNQFAKHPIRRIHIIGGGARNKLLCQFTADATGLPVIAGPTEATAIGNIMAQAMASGDVNSLAGAKAIVKRSFNLEIYRPKRIKEWDRAYNKFLTLI